MRIEEERLGKELADAVDTLVIADGPLTFQEASRGAVIGYIKRIFKLYLPREHLELLARLAAGERTPVFALRSSRRFVRFSWFVRLAPPTLGTPSWQGLRALRCRRPLALKSRGGWRMQVQGCCHDLYRGDGGIRAVSQNLLPIGALEASLRRHLGDRRLIRRYIETLIAGEARGG